MANEFIIKNGFFSQGSSNITGSLSVSQGITGSLFGTASWSQNSSTASYVLNAISSSLSATASYLNTLNQDLTFNGNLTLNGTASISFLNVTYESASVIYSSGSNQLGDAINDTQTLIGTIRISGSTIMTGSLAQGQSVSATHPNAHAQGFNTLAAADSAHAEGNSNQANGAASHAEGYGTVAQTNFSHTEGYNTQTITANGSHAEGHTTVAAGDTSHAEGYYTRTGGQAAHSEGAYTTASANYSHAEGSSSISLGVASHAEGLHTIASGAFQHTAGKYNTHGDTTSLFIIGNGTADNTRSDIFRVTTSDVQISGSLRVSQGITGSLFGTASWAQNVTSASFASTASSITIANDADNYITTANGNGTLNAESLLTFDGTKLSVLYQSGDEGGEILLNKPVTNTTLTGSGITIDSYQNKIRFFEQGGAARGAYIDITACAGGAGTNLLSPGGGVSFNGGTNVDNRLITATGTSPELNGEANLTFNGSTLAVTGNVTANSFTGSFTGSLVGELTGTASWASNATTASYILNAISSSFATTASYILQAVSSSYALSSTSASYALTASFALNGGGSVDTGSLVTTSSFNQFTSSYYQDSASFKSSITSLTNATSSYILNSQTSSMTVLSASYALTASYVLNAISTSYSSTASYVNPLIQDVQITGSLFVSNSIDSRNRYLVTSDGINIVDWENKALYGNNSLLSVHWGNRKANDASEIESIDWQNRTLFNSEGITTVNWNNGTLIDSAAANSVNWESRLLYDSDTTVVFDWQNKILTASLDGTASYANQALTSSIAGKSGAVSSASFGGSPFTASVTFGTAFANTSYAITITGEDDRVYTVNNKQTTGFIINTNSSTLFTGSVYWMAMPYNS